MSISYNEHKPSICILGLGYVGLTLAVTLVECGYTVHGVEIRTDVIQNLLRSEPHFWEKGLKDKLSHSFSVQRFSVSEYIDKPYDVYIITVGTPLYSNKHVRTDMMENAAKEVAKWMQNSPLIILRSTVRVGTTRQIVKPILDSTCSKYGLAYCPERTLEGMALEELRYLPQIIGGFSPDDVESAAKIFRDVTPTTVRVSSLEAAEFIKLIDNAQRDVLFAYSNEVAILCDNLGISATEVILASRLGYSRSHLANPGLVGGPCLEKDSYILRESLLARGKVEPSITMASRHLNESCISHFIEFIKPMQSRFPKKPILSLLGLAFKGKPETDDTRGTMARFIMKELRDIFPDAEFRGWDPVVQHTEIANMQLNVFDTIQDSIKNSNLVVICNNHELFNNLDLEVLSSTMAHGAIIYDFWNNFTLRHLNLSNNVSYVGFGSHARMQ